MSRRSCGYCHESGHNRSTCPREKERVETIRETRPESWTVTEYDGRQKRRKETRARAVSNRACSYCDQGGHNRRSCSMLKEHRNLAYRANRMSRAGTLTYMREHGIGVGAMMMLTERFFNDEKDSYERRLVPYLVTKINWQTIDGAYFVVGKLDNEPDPLVLQNLHSGQRRNCNLMDEEDMKKQIATVKNHLDTGEDLWSIYAPVIMSPAPRVIPPSGWLSSASETTSITKRFKDKDTTKWAFNNRTVWNDARELQEES